MSSLRSAPVSGALLASSLAAALAVPAHAEEAADGPNIVVIGQREADANPNADKDAPFKVNKSQNEKFTEPLRDTPKSVTAIPKEVIDAIGATSFREVVRSTPGVTLGTGEGGNAFGDRIFIRGFEARNDVYIDGLRDPGVTSRETFAVEQIEVVKGPSGAYGGRGTTGGLVSVQSKRANFDRSFAVLDAGVGTDSYTRETADVNYVISDKAALRVNGLYHYADTPGRDFVYSRRWGATAALSVKPADNLTISADYYYYRLRGLPDYGIPFDPNTMRPGNVDRTNFYGVLARDFIENDADVATLRIEWQPAENVTLRSTTRYGETANRYVVGAPERPDLSSSNPDDWTATSNPKNSNRRNRYWANATDMTARFATGGIEHAVVAGAEFADERVRNQPYGFDSINVGTADNPVYVSPSGVVMSYLHPDPTVAFDFPLTLGSVSNTRVKSAAGYIVDTVKLTPHLSVLLGGRYDRFDLSYDSEDADGRTPGLQPLKLGYDKGFWNWQASVIYKPSTPLTFYASYATSTNPSGEQIDGSGASYDGISEATVNLEPEKNKAWELGAKWEVADDLLLTAALFRIDKDNARENAGGGVYVSAGKLRSQGFEASVAGTVFGRLQLFGGYSYNDATIIASSDPANVGKRFANVPQHSGSLLATWTFGKRFEIGGQVYAQSRIYGGTTFARDTSVPGYVRFDAVARFRVNNGLDLRLNVLNLTDKVYYDAIYRSGTPFAYIAPGRSAMVTATARF
ncbi:TonB-dependent siderophore receptor [Novosphingobium sp. ZN18A2]|uniref:TonB-dependent receptor n=1 Tax=Novosphingobium sp. ZN18A2 TaxID=3079861 RepID=UPI0030D2E841